RVMVAHRRGTAGVAHWSDLVEAWVEEAASSAGGPAGPDTGPWYLGRPLLVTANDRETGLYNGDTGVVVADGEGGVVAVFGDPDRPLAVRPHRLPPVETVHAMTIHRGPGSPFARAPGVLPVAHPRAALHGRHPRARAGPGGRHRGRRAPGGGDPGPAGERAARPAVGRSIGSPVPAAPQRRRHNSRSPPSEPSPLHDPRRASRSRGTPATAPAAHGGPPLSTAPRRASLDRGVAAATVWPMPTSRPRYDDDLRLAHVIA